MKRWIMLAIILLFSGLVLKQYLSLYFLKRGDDIEVLVVYSQKSYQVEAFKSVLEEEGVPYRLVNINVLLSEDPEKLAELKPALILPDGSLHYIHPSSIKWFEAYVKSGGGLFISQDVGVKDYTGAYLKEAIFSGLLGINYILYDKIKEASYSVGYVKVLSKELEITPGKFDRKERLITGYIYGNLVYPYAKTEDRGFLGTTLAVVIDKDEAKPYQALVWKKYGKGYLFYSSLPLGHLKAYSDDLILRATIRYFLFKLIKIPHLVNTPHGKGGIVINWHIDANADWISIPMMLEKGYLRKGIEYSLHITAGPFRDEHGDNLGFDACGKGKKYVEMILPYGVIGSHGGWAHNWFSNNILSNKLTERGIYEYIKKNNDCLESITGYRIREYSAPNGVHPQPKITKILEDLGFVAYYYTGDSGSSPNRTFIDGKMVSSKVIAFPISPYDGYASFYEMYKNGVSEEEVYNFLKSLTDFVIRTRQVRLFYSHPYDIPHYPKAILEAINYWEKKEKEGVLEVHSMSYFADFILRFLKTEYAFKKSGKKELIVHLKNPEGLKDIAIAIPSSYGEIFFTPQEGVVFEKDENYYYFYFTKNLNKIDLRFNFN